MRDLVVCRTRPRARRLSTVVSNGQAVHAAAYLKGSSLMVDFVESVPDFVALGRLNGRGAIVIGAGQGFGRHTAHALRAAGAHVAIVDLNPELAEELATEVSGVAITADVRHEAEVQRALDVAVAALGHVHAVVDIVGLGKHGPLVDLTDADWTDSYDVNFRHVTVVVRVMGRYLARQGTGSIVFIGSISGLGSAPNHGAYGAFKAAMHALVRTAGFELAASNVRVNAVAPGLTATPRVLAQLPDMQDVGVLGGLPQARDIGAAVYYLCSDLSRMVTGHVLVVDAGQTLRYPVEVPQGIVHQLSVH
jgi:NAD(P)-dependent dehydrogenase (short-subunit alcohol dehydrogenase family)